MTGLFLFEGRRFWKPKKTRVIILLLIITLVTFIVFNIVQDKLYWIKQAADLTIERVVIESEVKRVNNELLLLKESMPDNLEAAKNVEKQLDFLTNRRYYNIQQINYTKHNNKDNAMARVELWLESDRHLLSGIEAGFPLEEMGFKISGAEIPQRISVNEYLIQQKVQPLNSPYEMTATNFIYKLFDYPWIAIILLPLFLLNIDIFSADFDGGAYKVLYSRHFSRRGIYFVKSIVRYVYSMLIVSCLLAIAFCLIGALNGYGEAGYPISYLSSFHQLTATGSQVLLPWIEYFYRAISLYLIVCSFIIILTGTISLLTKDTLGTLSVSICILFLDYSLRTVFNNESSIYMFWPLAPSVINNVLQGAYRLSALAYLVLLIATTIVLLAVGLCVIVKQDLKGGSF